MRDQDVGPADEDAARRLIYLAITNARPAWTGTAALLAFKVHVRDRIPN